MFGKGYKILNLFGIEIKVDPSWLFIFLLVTFNLAVGVFPALHPQWGAALSWGVGVAASVLFFSSVLAHELAHSLVARSKGLPITEITLFIFGGVSNIEREPETPGAEFVMALAGPLTSIVLGIIFLFIGNFLVGGLGLIAQNPQQALLGVGPLATLFIWLGPINILLGFFNLIPGFPLDGGRLLRAILWAATNNLKKATRWASWAGQVFGWIFIFIGVFMALGIPVPFFGRGLFGGLWLLFIGWFLSNLASQGYRQVLLEDVLRDVRTSTLMRPMFSTVSPEVSVSSLVNEHIMGTEDRAFLVIDGGDLRGIVTLDDVRKVSQSHWGRTKVVEIMTPREELITVAADEPAIKAFEKLTGSDVNQLPVLKQDQAVGLVSRRDILLWLQAHGEKFEEE